MVRYPVQELGSSGCWTQPPWEETHALVKVGLLWSELPPPEGAAVAQVRVRGGPLLKASQAAYWSWKLPLM